MGSGYTGHYVLVCGYDGNQGCFVVRDPASSKPASLVSGASLEEARKSFGTDEDLLIIAMRQLAPGVEDRVLHEAAVAHAGAEAAALPYTVAIP